MSAQFDKLFAGGRFHGGAGGDADTGGDAQGFFFIGERVLPDPLAKALAQGNGFVQVGVGQDHGELFATVATGHIVFADAFIQQVAEFLEHPVAAQMAVSVVDPFEMVEIDHAKGQSVAIALGARKFPIESFLQVAPVEHAGQLVTDGHFGQFFPGRCASPVSDRLFPASCR